MAGNNARHTRRYTDTQKHALLHAVLVGGHTGAEAVRMAREGRLGLPAFEVDRHYVYSIIRHGREGFENRDDGALQAGILAEIRASETDALANVRAIRAAFTKDGTDDLEGLARATKALTAIQRARRDATQATANRVKPQGQSQNSEPDNVNTPQGQSPLSDLLALAPKATRQGARTGSLGDARIGPDAA
jgi:hypothetical protein